mmetsp:Transcript_14775/g.30062  ORF Transcript_14775/g.30062 Transcript_14775/m.30062 type:complete len:81 (-) Transcript_14775:1956-2198(-)
MTPAKVFQVSTKVWFAPLSPSIIWAYIHTREPMDKAGAYGIQGLGGSFVTGIQGCYYSVMGFPMHAFSQNIIQLIEDDLL